MLTCMKLLPRCLVAKVAILTSHVSLPCSLKLVFLSLGRGPYLQHTKALAKILPNPAVAVGTSAHSHSGHDLGVTELCVC